MKKIVKISLIVVAIIVLIIIVRWCSNGSNSSSNESGKDQDTVAILKPHSTAVKGYLSDVFEVADEEYKFEYKTNNYTGEGTIQIKIKTIGKGDPKDYSFADNGNGPLCISICDKNGVPIADFNDIESRYSADELLKDMVKKVGEENWIEFEISTYQGKRLPSDAVGFIATSKQAEKKSESSSSSSSTSSSTDSQDWDKVLDDYEAYMDKYVEAIKKAKDEDPDMLTDLAEMLEMAEDISEDLQAANSSKSLTSSQVSRMMKIQQKMTKAMQQMQ